LIYYSIGYTAYTSTLDWDGVGPNAKPVGAENYTDMFSDPVFWECLQHTVVYFVGSFTVITALGFLLAAMLHSKVFLPTIYKIIFFVPAVIAPATMAPVFRLFYSPKGMFNSFLSTIGLDWLTHPWLADTKTALATIIVIHVWQGTGTTFILFYAAMSQIEPDLLEAARLDGAGNFRTLLHVVWPGVRGTTVALAMLSIIGALKTFDVPWLVALGGPSHATEFLGTYIYRRGIQESHMGYSATLSIALLVLSVVCTVIVSRTNRRNS
jgi:raffinose/stachyose/melibiose transport system permease protein